MNVGQYNQGIDKDHDPADNQQSTERVPEIL